VSLFASVLNFSHIALLRQVGISDLGQDDVYDIFGEISSRGLSRESLKKLPQFVVTEQVQGTFGENLPCTICLQVQLPSCCERDLYCIVCTWFWFNSNIFSRERKMLCQISLREKGKGKLV
jgi:hypothetical protein